ncbi:hypothetical protein C8R45DRAFT_1094569 [Mycena sanguinolenta]|nr:hypothetical protein C8R45DRAFT_1094569 [Mycena sanguinolenta]
MPGSDDTGGKGGTTSGKPGSSGLTGDTGSQDSNNGDSIIYDTGKASTSSASQTSRSNNASGTSSPGTTSSTPSDPATASESGHTSQRTYIELILPFQFNSIHNDGDELRSNLGFTKVRTSFLRANIKFTFVQRYRYSTPLSPSSMPPIAAAAGTHKHKVSSGAVAGIAAVAAVIFLVCIGVTLCWQIRRRRLRDRTATTISPFAPASSDARRISAIARERLETQLRAATEKIEELTEGSTGTSVASAPSTGEGGAGSELVSPASASAPHLEAELRTAREQINMLAARIDAMDSVWGIGGDESPPEYA